MAARGLRHCAVVHYHEISLKRGNRPLFLRHLQQNLLRAIADLGHPRLVQLPGRIVLDLAEHPEPEAVLERLHRVFGVANLALAWQGGTSLDELKRAVDRAIEGRRFGSFRITARRAFKTFPLTSVDLNRALGAHVLERRPEARVDLERAECNVHVEALPGEAFVYCDRRPGPGGLPVGASGVVAALLSGGIDSPVAAWRMMKRGCRVVFVHFHSAPYLPDTSQKKARELVERLTRWQYFSRLFLVPFGEIQREVVLAVPPPLRVVVYRRLMVRIAERLGRLAGAQALVTGESLGQVASQTLENLSRIDEVATLPLLRPLIGMDKLEITDQAKGVGTYEISIEPDADCCTLFVPRHPGTRVGREEIMAAESRLDITRLVEQGVAGAAGESFDFPPGAGPYPARRRDGEAPRRSGDAAAGAPAGPAVE
jgi:thiamine biosynthesis protein ThiI